MNSFNNQDFNNNNFNQNKKNKKPRYQNKQNKNKKDKEKKEEESTPNPNNSLNKNRIQKSDLKNLDDFIQNCLNKFKFVEPMQLFYDRTGKDKDQIISHKSTIPDLVIWNKTFNKNECFEDADLNKPNDFPRYTFFLRLNKDKDSKKNNNKNKEKKNKKSKKN